MRECGQLSSRMASLRFIKIAQALVSSEQQTQAQEIGKQVSLDTSYRDRTLGNELLYAPISTASVQEPTQLSYKKCMLGMAE